ncbi:MAG: bifunctional riboflavin kinase/FAD synthetase [Candidatus Delongbacteria bacterium]
MNNFIISELSQLKHSFVSLTIGSFDGLHKGHNKLLKTLKNSARKLNTISLLVTFEPHPRKVIDVDFDLKLLNTKEEKLLKLKKSGLDHINYISFSREFADTGYREFYTDYIFSDLNVGSIVAGANHFFGKNRHGDKDMLLSLCRENSIELILVDPVLYQGKKISSTRIRDCITRGNIAEANTMLGYNYSISGIVETGDGVGSELGFPTANINLDRTQKVIPDKGVYLVKTRIDNDTKYGISYLGTKPTFSKTSIRLETHIFDLNSDIYSKNIRVEFLKKIRGEKIFSSAKELSQAILKDKTTAIKMLKNKGQTA